LLLLVSPLPGKGWGELGEGSGVRASGNRTLASCGIVPGKEHAMIASDVQQRIDTLAEQLANLRGYL